jgi:hypothetical protein
MLGDRGSGEQRREATAERAVQASVRELSA